MISGCTLVVKTWWSLEEDVTGKILQVPFGKMQDLLERFSVEAAVQDPCVRLSVQGAYRRSPRKIFVRDLLSSYQKRISEQDLCSLHQVPVQDLLRGLLPRLLKRSL